RGRATRLAHSFITRRPSLPIPGHRSVPNTTPGFPRIVGPEGGTGADGEPPLGLFTLRGEHDPHRPHRPSRTRPRPVPAGRAPGPRASLTPPRSVLTAGFRPATPERGPSRRRTCPPRP